MLFAVGGLTWVLWQGTMREMTPSSNKPVIGIVGGIGAGKSVVANCFADQGYTLIDADTIGHALLDTQAVREAIVDTWGSDVLNAAGQVDRHALGRLVFAAPAAMAALNRIMHPRMAREIQDRIDQLTDGSRGAVVDAAVLFEAGWDALCDSVVYVDTPFETRLERVSANRGWDEAELHRRESHQIPLDKKRALCDYALGNHASVSCLEDEVRQLIARIEQTHGDHPTQP